MKTGWSSVVGPHTAREVPVREPNEPDQRPDADVTILNEVSLASTAPNATGFVARRSPRDAMVLNGSPLDKGSVWKRL